jgi:hypothetical protein
MSVLDTSKKQVVLAAGVSSALNPTALGVIFCMYILFGFAVVKSIGVSLVERIQHGTLVVSNLLVPKEVAVSYAQALPPVQSMGADQSNSIESADKGPEDGFDENAVEDIKDEEEII